MAQKVEEKTEENVSNPYVCYTNAALVDVILYQVSSKKRRNTDKDRPKYSYWTVDGEEKLEWVNLNYAYTYLHRYFYLKPRKAFEIRRSDLTPALIEKLERLRFQEINEIMIDVVRRILEAVDSYYYHISGIHDKIAWRFVD